MAKIPTLLEMLQAGVHFGHKRAKRHPAMQPFIYGEHNGVNIIDLAKTNQQLVKAYEAVKAVAAKGGTILFVGTKTQVKEIIKKYAAESGSPFIVERWLGGTLTNFQVISRLTSKLKKLESMKQGSDWDLYTKKERLVFDRDRAKLETLVGGIKDMNIIPQLVVVTDCKKDKTALTEAKKTKIPVVAITDTNVDPRGIAYPIPANDDALNSLGMIIGLLSQAIVEGKKERAVNITAKQ
jgi:small subunit ribosomal protein S2